MYKCLTEATYYILNITSKITIYTDFNKCIPYYSVKPYTHYFDTDGY